MKHKIEVHVIVEWDDKEYPTMADAYLSPYEGELVVNNELFWDLHGGNNLPDECVTKFTAEHSAT